MAFNEVLARDLLGATEDTLSGIRKMTTQALTKAITTSTGITGYSLEAPAKQTVPVLTPLRNRIPREVNPSGMGATATNWKVVTAINNTGVTGGVAEGAKGNTVTTVAGSKTATYKRVALNDSVTIEARLASRNFDDVRARATVNLLYAVMLEEEYLDLGGNASLTLGATAQPAGTGSATGGTMPAATYTMKCAGVTLEGKLGKINAAGTAIGIGALSAASAGITTSGTTSSVAWTIAAPINGAVAYNWYASSDGVNYYLQATTTTTAFKQTSHSTAGAVAPGAASDTNALVYDGILTQGYAAGSGAIITTPVAGNGQLAKTDIDSSLLTMWDNNKIQPSIVWANAHDFTTITNNILSAQPNHTVYLANQAAGLTNLIGNAMVAQYLSPVTGQLIDIRVHPYLPQGTILMKAETLPYPNNSIPRVLEKELRLEYTQLDYALTSPTYSFDCTFDGVLKDYFPAGTAIIRNITATY